MTNPVLLGYQSRWIADQAQVRVIEKSRRIGISWAMACEATLYAAHNKPKQHVAYIGYNREMARTFIDDCATWARAINVYASSYGARVIDQERGVLSYALQMLNGNRITALSSRPTNFRSRGGLAIIDEAAFHESLDELLKAVMPFTVWGGRVVIISTHNGVSSPFAAMIDDIRSGATSYSLHRVTLDDALQDGLYRRICEVTGVTWSSDNEHQWREDLINNCGSNAQEELFCVPSRSGGQYIDPGLIERACSTDKPVVRYNAPRGFVERSTEERTAVVDAWLASEIAPLIAQQPKSTQCVIGEDFGRHCDMTCIVPLYIDKRARYDVPFVVELHLMPYDQQVQVMRYLIDNLRAIRVAMDATGNGDYVAETIGQEYGRVAVEGRAGHKQATERRAKGIKITQQWYADTLPPLRRALEDDLLTIPRDVGLISDLSALRVIDGLPKLPKLKIKDPTNKTQTRHGDFAIALALAYDVARTQTFAPIKVVRVDRTHGTSTRHKTGLTRGGGLI